MRPLVDFAFDYYQRGSNVIALVVAENQSDGQHIRKVHKMRTFGRCGAGARQAAQSP